MAKSLLALTASSLLPTLATCSFQHVIQTRPSFISFSPQNRPSIFPSLELPTALRAQPNKGDLYSDDELMQLLSIHLELNPEEEIVQTNDDGNNDDLNEASIPGFHDLVLQTINDIDQQQQHKDNTVGTAEDSQQQQQNNLQHLQQILKRKSSIRAIASDVDGTLLSSGQSLHPLTLQAVLNAIDEAKKSTDDNIHVNSNDATTASLSTTATAATTPTTVTTVTTTTNDRKIDYFFAATGKSRKGAADSLGPEIGPLLYTCPGVYIQGLYCVDGNNNVVFEKKLPTSAIAAAEELVKEFGISIVAYDGDNLYTTEQTEIVIGLSKVYGEPTVELLSELGEGDSVVKYLSLAEHEPGIHKLLLMDDDIEKLTTVIRPRLEDLACQCGATVTQALPTMLELLPDGCSKANGVSKVCEALGIDPTTELLALGDAENDAGMLKMASIGVAVGNACPQAREAADYIMKERNDEGGAGLAIEMFGLGN